MRSLLPALCRWTALLTFALGICACDPGPGITVTCLEADVSQPVYIGVKNPHSKVKDDPNSIWVRTGMFKFTAPKSPAEACDVIYGLAKDLKLSAVLKDKTTVVIYGSDIEVTFPPEIKIKVDKF
jgi:hypothetical protein